MPEEMTPERRMLLKPSAHRILTEDRQGMGAQLPRRRSLPENSAMLLFPCSLKTVPTPKSQRTTAQEIWETQMERLTLLLPALAPAEHNRDGPEAETAQAVSTDDCG